MGIFKIPLGALALLDFNTPPRTTFPLIFITSTTLMNLLQAEQVAPHKSGTSLLQAVYSKVSNAGNHCT